MESNNTYFNKFNPSLVEKFDLLKRVRDLYNKEYSIDRIARECRLSIRDARYYYNLCTVELSW